MSDPFDLPPGVERHATQKDRVAFAELTAGTRRLVRIESVTHVEQRLMVEPCPRSGEVALKQHCVGERARALDDWVYIRMAPEEARRIAALLVAGADAVDDVAMRAADGQLRSPKRMLEDRITALETRGDSKPGG